MMMSKTTSTNDIRSNNIQFIIHINVALSLHQFIPFNCDFDFSPDNMY